jgi:type IV pilus assembly protein PilP
MSACSDSTQQDLSEWMLEQKNSFKPKVQPISEPKKFQPTGYVVDANDDPFNFKKLSDGLAVDLALSKVQNSALIEPELKRRREPLEAFPLDAIFFVGTLEHTKSKKVALVKVNNQIYQVSIGSYLGSNYGKVISISESEIVLRELIQESSGEWIEKPASMQIQEDKNENF